MVTPAFHGVLREGAHSSMTIHTLLLFLFGRPGSVRSVMFCTFCCFILVFLHKIGDKVRPEVH